MNHFVLKTIKTFFDEVFPKAAEIVYFKCVSKLWEVIIWLLLQLQIALNCFVEKR